MPLVVGNDTITWLRYGLLEGKATGGQAVLKGPLHEFRFHESKEHHFLVSVNAEDVFSMSIRTFWTIQRLLRNAEQFGRSLKKSAA